MPWAFMQSEIATILGDEYEEFKRQREAAGLSATGVTTSQAQQNSQVRDGRAVIGRFGSVALSLESL